MTTAVLIIVSLILVVVVLILVGLVAVQPPGPDVRSSEPAGAVPGTPEPPAEPIAQTTQETTMDDLDLADPPAPDRLLVPPPVVDGPTGQVTLHQWARTTWGDERTFAQGMVTDFYTANLTDGRVSGFFPGHEGVTELRKHFVNAFLVLARDGLRESTAATLEEVHRKVRGPNGERITTDVYDVVISHLVETLTAPEYDVPNTPECMGRIGMMAAAARPLIAVDAA